MRSAVLVALAAVLAAAPAALAQDPPPAPPAPAPAPAPPAPAPKAEDPAPVPAAPKPAEKPAAPAKHVNKISDAAKAIWDAMRKATGTPEALGIKDFKGSLSLDMQGMAIPFTVEFQAPATLKATLASDDPNLAMMGDMLKAQVTGVMRLGLGLLEPEQNDEFDADVVVEKDVKTLVIKHFEKNEEAGEFRLTLNADGLPAKGVRKQIDPNMGMEMEISMAFTFAKEGERFLLKKLAVNHPMAGEIEMTISHVDAGGIKFPKSIESTIMSMTFTELTLNGKKVEFPKPEPKKEEAKPVPAAPAGGDAAKPPEGEKKPEDPKPEPKPEEKKEEPK